jgi:hypothetical protein
MFDKMFGYVLGDLGTAMPIEYSKKSNMGKSREFQFCNIAILHMPAPALHFASRIEDVLILFPSGGLVGDRLF